MADLNVTLFAFATREKRFVLTRATGGYLIASALLGAAYIAVMWTAFGDVFAWYFEILGAAANGEEPSAPPQSLLGLLPLGLGVGLIGVVILAAFEAACLRWLVRGESGGGLLGLTLGADTWRVLLTYLVWLLLGVAFIIVCVLPFVLLSTLHGAVPALAILWMLLGALTPLGLLALILWVSTRLAPAAAVSVQQQRFAFFSAWSVTKPHFWPLLGSFVLLTVGYFVMAIVVGQLFQIPFAPRIAPLVQAAMTGGDSAALAAQAVELLRDPVIIGFGVLYVIATSILRCVFYIAFFGVNAGVVRASEEPAVQAS